MNSSLRKAALTAALMQLGARRDREAVADAQPKPEPRQRTRIPTEFVAYEGGIDLVPVAPKFQARR